MMRNLNPLVHNSVCRLSQATRELAKKYLGGEFRSDLQEPDFTLEDLKLTEDTSPLMVHAQMAELIAKRAPIILRSEERLAGSASLLPSLRHAVPGMNGRGSISHTTVDFGDAVGKGLSGLEQEILQRVNKTPAEQEFCQALLHVISAMRIWSNRYVHEYRKQLATQDCPIKRENLKKVLDTLEHVPENPPKTFHEALQSFWMFFEFQRLCGNWSGLGRFDWILGPYLDRDLERGILTLDEARELISHFWIKGTEWCFGLRQFNPGTPGTGDAQNYQNIILGGVAPDWSGNVDNAVTELVLDVVEELHISDYPIAVRLNRNTTPALLRRIAEVQLLGGGIVSVYNEEIVLDGLRRFGFPEHEIASFTNDGCWEVILPGKTAFGYNPFDALNVFQKALFAENTPSSFEELYENYHTALKEHISGIKCRIWKKYDNITRDHDAVLSLLMPSCRKNGRSYTDFGADYTIDAIHAGGLPDVANSLLAIQKYVFEQNRLSLAALIEILKNNWIGHETLRLEFANTILYYGNDDTEADSMMKRVFDDYALIVAESKPIPKVLTPAGISTFGREIQFAPERFATAFGKHAHEYLASNLSPTPGTEKNALTAVLNSYCKMDFTVTPNGCPLDLRLSAGIRKLPNAPDILAALLRVFLERGGFYLQIDTVDLEMLRAAKKDPDRFPNLVVRISGWSARFVSLSEEWQDMIINRTALEVL